jgi:hypothetical protein
MIRGSSGSDAAARPSLARCEKIACTAARTYVWEMGLACCFVVAGHMPGQIFGAPKEIKRYGAASVTVAALYAIKRCSALLPGWCSRSQMSC